VVERRQRTTTAPAALAGNLTDVDGLLVGHTRRVGRGWRTGTTVVVAPTAAVGGVDVRGGGPGTHETDLLRPENLVERIHAVCLTGGSAFGLAATTGVMAELEARGIGFPVGRPGAETVVPIVPAAVIFDLGRAGDPTHRPDASFGARATRDARRLRAGSGSGAVGAGTGAMAGGLQGGIGQASVRLADGTVVAALAVVNSLGSVIDPSTGLPWEHRGLGVSRPGRAELAALRSHLDATRPPLNTVIGVVATDDELTKAECTRFAGVAHDGLARAVRPAHTLFDGDTIFALATGRHPGPATEGRTRALRLSRMFEAGAECFALACTRAVLETRSLAGGPPAYRELCPSVFPAGT
jgi:L-aminopeptidase/D-esterase-like protein